MINAQRYACTHVRNCVYIYANPEKYYVEQVQKSFNMDVGMHHAKNRGNKEIPLAILSRILAQSYVTPPYIIQAKGLHMIVLVSLIVLLRGFPCFHDFSHGASLHPYSFIFALVCSDTVYDDVLCSVFWW